ncbi:MAG TPA: retroviral-like aspartic protease family protein [Segetibacter sp.]|nr:retroviral-like aspartic protease family protein [Segetibacter sp.]
MFTKQNKRWLVWMFLVACVTFSNTLFAEELPEPQKSKLITKFPFILTSRGIIIIKANVGIFHESLNFVLDTGSGGISLDSAVAERYHLTANITDDTIKGIAQIKRAAFIMNQSLTLPGLTVDNLNFHLNDYSFLSSAHNIRIDGVIGYSFLKSFVVGIDYDKQVIEIWKPGTYVYPKNGYIVKTNVDKLAAVNVTLNDSIRTESHFYFDTGADMSFLLSEAFVEESNVLKNNKKIFLSGAEGIGGRKEMLLTTIDEVSIGPYAIKKVPAYIFNDTYNISNYPQTGGVIGNEIMARFNVIINYPAGEIHISPNMTFKNPFDYSYVGCTVIEENGRATIKNIVKDSPAQWAGLKDDDIIFGINNNFNNNVGEYKTLLSDAGAKLKVFLLRGGQVTSTTLEVKSIL